MSLKNTWVGYTQRSYAQIMASLLTRLRTKVPEMTDHSPSNLFIVIMQMFAGLGEQLHFYIDNLGRESYIGTARRFSSMVKLVKLIDYRIKSAISAKVDLELTFLDPSLNPVAATGTYTITVGTKFLTDNGVEFIATEAVDVEIGDFGATVPAQQATDASGSLGTTNAAADQEYLIGSDYLDESMELTVNAITWERQTTLGRSSATDKHFIVDIREDGNAYVVFGDGVNGDIPPSGFSVAATYKTTQGSAGNVALNTIINWDSEPTITGVDSITVDNVLAASGGLDIEDADRIRRAAPLSLRTLDRAVTRQDFIDILKLAPGVGKADIEYVCGQVIDGFIVPEGGGIAQSALISATETYIDERKMLTATINIKPAGESQIYLLLEVKRKAFVTKSTLETAVEGALSTFYTFSNVEMNQRINQSDIYFTAESENEVDYLTIKTMYVIPYARPTNSTTILDWDVVTRPNSNGEISWRLEYDGSQFRLYKNEAFQTNIDIGDEYTDDGNIVRFTINASSYTLGEEWEFKTFAYNKDVQLTDNTVPAISGTNIHFEHL